MTTMTCQKNRVSLPVIESTPGENPLAAGISGPRNISAVKMLRISITDVCNLRCVYCMPEEGVEWLGKSEILSFEEIAAIVRASAALGITHFKLTGGEPTARKDLHILAAMLRKIPGVHDLSLTTNGILLAPMLPKLKDAGVSRITISLDSLKPQRFSDITRGGDFHRVWQAIESALALNFERIKLNIVVMRSMNEDEVADFAKLTLKMPITVRFIEFMPLGRSGFTDSPERVMISEKEIREKIEDGCGPLLAADRRAETGVGPAKIFRLENAAGKIGFISAMSAPFCDTCNRLRLTPEGILRSCLFDGGEVDLKPILRNEKNPADGNLRSTEEKIQQAMTQCATFKPETHSFHGNKAMNRIGG
jgi:cyclic pyranopterin phosphate synthase